jgi:hypothetical protein
VKHLLIATAALVVSAPAVSAKEKVVFVETAIVKDKPVVTLNPAKAYILIRSTDGATIHLMRVPSAEDQVKYDALKAEAFAEAREKYAKKQASYDKAKAAHDRSPKGAAKPVLPEKPVEPTEENFEFTPFGLMTGIVVGPLNRFSKGDDDSVYLQEVTPGSYRIYSATPMACFCMGSVKFEAKAGEITDVGVFDTGLAAERTKGDSAQPGTFVLNYRASGEGRPADPRLSAMKVVPAALSPVGKLPNYFGGSIDRFPAIEGVMRYDRDRIVDLTAAQ